MPRVLTIEDDEITAREMSAELRQHGIAVEWSATGQDGLAKAARIAYDAITLDRMLPDGDGLAILTAMRQSGTPAGVLMFRAAGAEPAFSIYDVAYTIERPA